MLLEVIIDLAAATAMPRRRSITMMDLWLALLIYLADSA